MWCAKKLLAALVFSCGFDGVFWWFNDLVMFHFVPKILVFYRPLFSASVFMAVALVTESFFSLVTLFLSSSAPYRGPHTPTPLTSSSSSSSHQPFIRQVPTRSTFSHPQRSRPVAATITQMNSQSPTHGLGSPSHSNPHGSSNFFKRLIPSRFSRRYSSWLDVYCGVTFYYNSVLV